VGAIGKPRQKSKKLTRIVALAGVTEVRVPARPGSFRTRARKEAVQTADCRRRAGELGSWGGARQRARA